MHYLYISSTFTLNNSFYSPPPLPPPPPQQGADGVGVSGAGGSGEMPEVTKRLQGADEGLVFGLDQAVHLSIDCACKSLHSL